MKLLIQFELSEEACLKQRKIGEEYLKEIRQKLVSSIFRGNSLFPRHYLLFHRKGCFLPYNIREFSLKSLKNRGNYSLQISNLHFQPFQYEFAEIMLDTVSLILIFGIFFH